MISSNCYGPRTHGIRSKVQLDEIVEKALRDAAIWDEKAKDLATRFTKNFVKYTGNDAGKALVAAGPQL